MNRRISRMSTLNNSWRLWTGLILPSLSLDLRSTCTRSSRMWQPDQADKSLITRKLASYEG
jgi:hypothetical protein